MPHGHGARQRHGRERDVDTQAGGDQALHVEDTPGPRTRPRDLHRLVQRPAPAPLAQADKRRADETASTVAGARAVQSASRPRNRGTDVIEPTWNPGDSLRKGRWP